MSTHKTCYNHFYNNDVLSLKEQLCFKLRHHYRKNDDCKIFELSLSSQILDYFFMSTHKTCYNHIYDNDVLSLKEQLCFKLRHHYCKNDDCKIFELSLSSQILDYFFMSTHKTSYNHFYDNDTLSLKEQLCFKLRHHHRKNDRKTFELSLSSQILDYFL